MVNIFYWIPYAIALIGSSMGAAWDIKTTEIPDELSYSMMVAGLIFYSIYSLLIGDYHPLIYSVVVGLSFFGFGFLMYYFGQWGGGDAKLLAAMGFLLPSIPRVETVLPLPLTYLSNVFLVGALYMIMYALMLAVRDRKIISEFVGDVRASSTIFLLGAVSLFTVLCMLGWFLQKHLYAGYNLGIIVLNSTIATFGTVFIFLLWKFAKAVENVGFKKKIPVKDLNPGDVLMDSKFWEGIGEEELENIKKSGKKRVWIKEGVRFAPAFPLALITTLYIGDLIFILVQSF